MTPSGGRLSDASDRLLTSWIETPAGVRRVCLFVAVAGLLPWLTITTVDMQNWVVGAEQVIAGESVYGPRVTSPYTGRVVPRYPYLPSFAMLLAAGIVPFSFMYEIGFLPEVAYRVIARLIANAPSYLGLLGIPLVVYRISSEFGRPIETVEKTAEDWAFWGVLVVALAPPLWIQVIESGSDAFVALLVLLGVYMVMTDRWLLAGLLVGGATFKFTALPLAAVLALYAISHGRNQVIAVATGGILSQLPNVLYFVLFVDDFFFVLQERGMMSYRSGGTTALATAPFRLMGLEQWYIEVGFLIASVLFVTVGAVVAIHRGNLVLGFAVAYLSSSYFAPVGEVKASVLVILLLVEAAVNFRRKRVRYLAAGLLIVSFYSFLLPYGLIDYVSVVPFPWWDIVIQGIEFGTVSVALVGLLYVSGHDLS
jgi:hypothetical protein